MFVSILYGFYFLKSPPNIYFGGCFCRCNRKSNQCSLSPSSPCSRYLIPDICCVALFLLAAIDKISPTFLVFPGGQKQHCEKTSETSPAVGQWLLSRWPGGFLWTHPSCLCWRAVVWPAFTNSHECLHKLKSATWMGGWVRSVECYWRRRAFIRFIHRFTFADIKHCQSTLWWRAAFRCESAFLLPLKFPLREVGFHRCCGFVWGFERYEVGMKWHLWHLWDYSRLCGHSRTSSVPQISGKTNLNVLTSGPSY